MTEFEFREFDEAYDKARSELAKAVVDPELVDYAQGNGLLQMTDIAPARREAEQLEAVVDLYGWPALPEDGIIEPVHNYPNSLTFLDSLCPDDEYGARHIRSSVFYSMLVQKPLLEMETGGKGVWTYGLMPVLHRAHALSPELFDNLRVVLATLSERYGGIYDEDNLRDELEMAHNESVRRAMHMAYRIMGRLIKVDDPVRFSDRFNAITGVSSIQESSPTTILSADDFLKHSM